MYIVLLCCANECYCESYCWTFLWITISPKKLTTKPALKKASINTQIKKEIIQKYEEGATVIVIACKLGKNSFIIANILKKKKEEIKGIDVANGITGMASKKKQPEILNEVEKLLLMGVNKKQLMGNSISETTICEKARALHDDLLQRTPGILSEQKELFKASRG